MKNNELNDKLNLDTIARRVKAPTSTFWKKVQIIGAALAFACGTILAAPIALPVALHTILVVGTTVGTVAAGLGQVTKEDQPVEEKNKTMNNNADTVLKWFPMLIQTGTLVALGLATYFNIVANNKIIEQRLTALELSEKELTKERPEIARQLSELKIELVRLRTVIEEGNNK